MFDPQFKKDIAEGTLNCSIRLNKKEGLLELAIYDGEQWELGVRGKTLQQVLERFQKAILRVAGECATPISP